MRKYKGFTLIEILIVMGIIIVLLAVGITVGRFAVQRSNRIKHQSAADELYRISLEYKNENGTYPKIGNCGVCIEEQLFAEALGYKGDKDILKPYLEKGIFDGGLDATYYYYVDPVDALFAIVCVSLGGIDDDANQGYYCVGDGLGFLPANDPLNDKSIGSAEDEPTKVNIIRGFDFSDWHKDSGFASGN